MQVAGLAHGLAPALRNTPQRVEGLRFPGRGG
jgi:hypothetical protein